VHPLEPPRQQRQLVLSKHIEDHVWFKDRLMVASLCDE
jgi:hypothetical protein